MKKAIRIVGVIIIFSILEALLAGLLGIKYPNFLSGITYNTLFLLNGAALYAAIKAK